MRKINVFVDMDGVLAVYDKNMPKLMYNEGHFLNCKPHKGNLSLVKKLISDEEMNVFILSTILSGSKFVEPEKNAWLDKYLPELEKEKRIFVPEGNHKSDFIFKIYPEFKGQLNMLIDDYTVNLIKWEESGMVGLKMLNGINNSNGIWLSQNPDSYINFKANPNHNYFKIVKILKEQNNC